MNKPNLEPLREKLSQQEWPNIYMYKFILPSDNEKIAKVQAIFTETAEVSMNQSSGGNYVSITAKEMALCVDDIISRYEQAIAIEGVRAL